MKHKSLLSALFFSAAYLPTTLFAHEYAPGVHHWKIKGGTVYVVSGLLTNNAALYAHNYSFYFQREGEKTWHQVPLIDKGKPGDYELNILSKAKEERMVRDARIEVKANDVFLLHARSAHENDLNASPVTIIKYRLISTEGDDWPHFFERISAKTYSVAEETGVDSVLKQEAKKIN